jgi:hypothetical protein
MDREVRSVLVVACLELVYVIPAYAQGLARFTHPQNAIIGAQADV